MANNSGVVGVLRALLTLDSGQFDTGMRKAVTTTDKTTTALGGLSKEVQKLTPQAERMVKAFGGDRLISTANNLASAIDRVGGVTRLTETQQRRANATFNAAVEQLRALGQGSTDGAKRLQALATATNQSSFSIKNLATTLGPFGPMVAGAFSATAVIGFGKAILDTADSLTKLHDRTGLSVRDLQVAQAAADDAGNSIEDVAAALTQLQIRSVQATPAFRNALHELNIEIDTFRGLNPIQQLEAISKGLQSIEDPAKQAALAFELGGRRMVEILPTMKQGFDEAKSASGRWSAQTVKDLDDVGDAITRWKRVAMGIGAAWLVEMITFGKGGPILVEQRHNLDALTEALDKARRQAPALQLPPALRSEIRGLTGELISEAEAEKDLTDRINENRKAREEAAAALAKQFSREMANNEALFETIDRVDALMLTEKRRLAAEQEQIAQQTAQKQLETFLQLNQSIIGLDAERLRNLLAMNAPGTGIWKEAGVRIGETLGGQIKSKLLNAFEDIPHFLTSSLLHSGSFINGLKALGVSMADAIVEPLLKQFAMKLAGARIASALAGGAGAAVLGGSAAAAGTVAAEVGGTAAATTAAVGGGSAGAAAGGFGGALSSFFTNPWTAVGAAAVVGGILAFRHFRKGSRANDARDKDLAQFAGFDSAADKQDTANPPGFHGLDRLLTKYKHHDLFGPFISARDHGAVRKAFAPIQAFMAGLGRNVKSFSMGGFVPPGVVQPAVLHGPEWVIPQSKMAAMGGGGNSYTYVTIEGMLDPGNFAVLMRRHGIPVVSNAFLFNEQFITTNAKKGLDR